MARWIGTGRHRRLELEYQADPDRRLPAREADAHQVVRDLYRAETGSEFDALYTIPDTAADQSPWGGQRDPDLRGQSSEPPPGWYGNGNNLLPPQW